MKSRRAPRRSQAVTSAYSSGISRKPGRNKIRLNFDLAPRFHEICCGEIYELENDNLIALVDELPLPLPLPRPGRRAAS